MKNVKQSTKMNKPKKNRFLLIFVCIFLAVILTVGAALGIMTAIKYKNAVVKYGSVTADAGTVNYLATYYKYRYVGALRDNGIAATDTPSFWSKDAGEGKTYGEMLEESFRGYLASVMVSNSIFLKYSSYTREDKAAVKRKTDIVLRNNGGSEESFNEQAKEYGFDYDDFLAGAELLYKSAKAQAAIYGINGANLENFPEECEKYLATYTRVSLIFISDELTFATDENNEKIVGDDGNYVMRPLSDEEKREREQMAERLRGAIENKKNGAEGQVSPEMFEYYLEKSDGDPNLFESGYYFHENAEETARYAEEYHPEVVEKALSMSVGEYAEVECSLGVCFIYKYDVAAGAYKDSDSPFFDDFYSDAVHYLYPKILEELTPDAEFSDSFSEIDILSASYDYLFYIETWN